MGDTVSIILPLYNGEKFIEETLRLIQASTYKDLEIVVVNDGSKDHGPALVEKLAKEDDRIKLYTKENGGIVSARNYGLERATGTYLCFCDQDDYVQPWTYESQVEAIQRDHSKIAMVGTGRSIDGQLSDFEVGEDACYRGREVAEELLYPMFFNAYLVDFPMGRKRRYPHIWNCMFDMQFVKEGGIRFRAYINFEDDYLFKAEALAKADCVSTIARVGYYWRVNLGSETYSHHYTQEIGKKQDLLYQDLLASLKCCETRPEVLEYFHQVTYCKQYMEAIHNVTSKEQKKSLSFLKAYYRDNIYGRDFDACIGACKNVQKGQVKAGIIMPLLRHRMTILSFLAELFLDAFMTFTLRSQFLTKLERSLKNSK